MLRTNETEEFTEEEMSMIKIVLVGLCIFVVLVLIFGFCWKRMKSKKERKLSEFEMKYGEFNETS